MACIPEGLKCAGTLIIIGSCIIIPGCLIVFGLQGSDISFFSSEDWKRLMEYALIGVGIIGVGFLGEIADNLSIRNANKNKNE